VVVAEVAVAAVEPVSAWAAAAVEVVVEEEVAVVVLALPSSGTPTRHKVTRCQLPQALRSISYHLGWCRHLLLPIRHRSSLQLLQPGSWSFPYSRLSKTPLSLILNIGVSSSLLRILSSYLVLVEQPIILCNQENP
jgi:hypothetical protein